MPDDLKQKTISGVSWSFVEQILARGVNFIIGIILARLLSPSDYGLVGMLGIFIAISQLFIDGGLASALIQQKTPTEKDFSTVYIINLVMSVLLYVVLYCFAPVIANFYSQPLLQTLLRVLSLSLIIGSVASVQSTLLSIRIDFRTKTYISILSSILSGIIGIICAYNGLGVWALVIQTLTYSSANSILTLLFVRWIPKLSFSIDSFKRLFSFSSKILAASIISTIYDNAYPLVIGKRFTAADVGLYSRAGQFPGVANSTISGALTRVAFPMLSKIQDDDNRLLRVYEKYVQLACYIIFPILMGLCGCARPLISLLLTDKWVECVPLMQILCFGTITNVITKINLNLLYVKGRSDLVLRLEILKKSIAFGILFLSMLFNLKIMCIGQVIYAYIALYLNTYYTKDILGYGFRDQIKSVFPYFSLSLIILAESLLIAFMIKNNLLSLIVAIVICSTTYILISKKTKIYAYNESINLIKEIIHRFNK